MNAQDLHFSQFYHNPQHLNPALTGMFEGEFRAAVLYRSQWSSVPVNYQTVAGAVDGKLLRRRSDLLSVGLMLEHDRAGDAALTWTQVGASAAVAHSLGADQALAAGFGLAVVQRTFDISGLSFKNQWNGEQHLPYLPSGESFNRTSGMAPTLSAGLNWLWHPDGRRPRVSAGIAAFHLNRPAISFHDEGDLRLPVRWTLQAQTSWPVGERLDVVGFALAGAMGTAREVVAGGGLHIPWTTGAGVPAAWQFTVATRLRDAWIPAVQLDYQNWTVGISYDWNISGFDVATNGRGGPEIAVIYRPRPVPPVKTSKACPIF